MTVCTKRNIKWMAHERKLNARYGVRYKLKQLLSQSSNMLGMKDTKNYNNKISTPINVAHCVESTSFSRGYATKKLQRSS